jgi:hypothetical protein
LEWASTTLSLNDRCFVLDDVWQNERLGRLSELAADMKGLEDMATHPMPDIDEDRRDDEDDDHDSGPLDVGFAVTPFCISRGPMVAGQRPDTGGIDMDHVTWFASWGRNGGARLETRSPLEPPCRCPFSAPPIPIDAAGGRGSQQSSWVASLGVT